MDKEYIKKKLIDIMQRNGISIIDELAELEVDSIQFITIILDVEEYFQIEIEEDDLQLDNLRTLEQFTLLISKLIIP